MAKKKASKRSSGRATTKKKAANKRTAAKRAATKRGKSNGARKTQAATSGAKKSVSKRTSLLDAAAQILAEAKEPMSCRDIVDEVLDRKLWATNGKTPHQTLYSAMLRETQKQGKKARFKKVGRGRFIVALQ